MTEPLFTLPPYDEAIAYLREHFDEIVWDNQYTAPCAIGCLIPEEIRDELRTTRPYSHSNIVANDCGIGILIGLGVMAAVPGDSEKYVRLQDANDNIPRDGVTPLRALIFGEVA